MAREKGISDEQIIAALITNGTLRAAASAVGISERALYDRMNNGEFQARYRAAKADVLREAVKTLNGQLKAAISTVTEIMMDKEANPAIRLQSAQTILNHAGKFIERLQAAEDAVETQIVANRWGIE